MAIADFTSPIRAKIIAESYKAWVKKGDSLLDIGCGTGVVADELRRLLKVKISGCDTDKYLLRNIHYKNMSSDNQIPFKSNQFNIAMFNDVLHHTSYKTQIKLIKDSLRVANEVFIFELIPTLRGKLLDYLLNKIHNPRMNIPFTYRRQKDWEKLFRNNSINYDKRQVKTPWFYPFSHVAYRIFKS